MRTHLSLGQQGCP